METTKEKSLNIETNFFRAIAALDVDGNLNLTIRKLKDGNLVVITMLTNERVGDQSRKNIVPLKISSTPKELDESYFGTISAPIRKTSSLLTNMEAYLKSIEEAAKKSRMEQDKKPKGSKEKSSKEDGEKADSYKKAMAEVEELEKKMEYKAAIEQLPKESEYPAYAADLAKKRTDLEAKSKLSLFS